MSTLFYFILQYKIDCRITIELLDTESEDPSTNVSNVQSWNSYCERLANPSSSGTAGLSGESGNTNMEIKTENPDDDSVSLNHKSTILLYRFSSHSLRSAFRSMR